MTNGDKIRSMTDEELAKLFFNKGWLNLVIGETVEEVIQDCVDWLKQEAKWNGMA